METEQNKSRAVENSNKLAKELKMVQVHHSLLCKHEKYVFWCKDQLGKLNQKCSLLSSGDRKVQNDTRSILDSIDSIS